MNKLEIKYKYIVGQIIYFMYKNEGRRGIVSKIRLECQSDSLKTYQTEDIINGKTIHNKEDYPINSISLIYDLDLVSKEGKFESAGHTLYEFQIYKTREEMIEDRFHG